MVERSSVIQEKWEAGYCRVEEGFFFGDDRVVLIKPAQLSDGTYTIAPQPAMPLAVLLQENPEGWIHIETVCQGGDATYVALAGYGSYEGEGFVALKRKADGQLMWLGHFGDSEAFSHVAIVDRQVLAISGEYPSEYRWMIPVDRPEVLRYSIRRPR